MTPRKTLLLIAAFIALTLGSFIWYIATWDAEERVDDQHPRPTLALLKILPPEAPAFQERAIL
jgi:hypothetical protein